MQIFIRVPYLQKSLMADEYGIFSVILTTNSQHLAKKAWNLTNVARYKVVKLTLQTLSDDMIITLSLFCNNNTKERVSSDL